MEDVLLLLRFNCPSPSCGYQASSWDSLEKHTLSVHQAVLCHLCRKQLSRFAHEQVLYPPHLLACHDPSRIPRGHRRPKIRNEKEEEMVAGWGPPHPMCEVSGARIESQRSGTDKASELSSVTKHSSLLTSCSNICVSSTRSVSFAKRRACEMFSEFRYPSYCDTPVDFSWPCTASRIIRVWLIISVTPISLVLSSPVWSESL
jgi:hypothetical protein